MVPPQTPQIAHIMTQIHENDNKKIVKGPKEPLSLDQLVKNIHQALGPDGGLDSDHIDANEILKLMEEYSSNSTDWNKYTIFDHSRAYTRNLIDDGNGKFNLMILAWSKGQQSPIHDHAGSHCIMKILDGELQETQYKWPESSNIVNSNKDDDECKGKSLSSSSSVESSDITEAVQNSSSPAEFKGNPLKTRKCTRLRPNEVAYIHDKIGLHRISNPDNDRGAVSLHLYTPPYQVCKTFEENTGRSRMGGKCTFYSIGGNRCTDKS